MLRPALWIVFGLLLTAVGCAQPRGPAGPEAVTAHFHALAQSMGRARALTLDLTMVASQPERERVIFTVSAWVTPDHTLRAHITRLGYPYLSIRIAPDGAVIAHQMLDGYATETDLDALLDAARKIDTERRRQRGETEDDGEDLAATSINLFQKLRLLIDEFMAGPIPAATAFRASTLQEQAAECTLPDGNRAVLRLSPDGRDIAQKWIHDAEGRELVQIKYRNPTTFDGLRRASRMAVSVSDHDGLYQVRVRRFDPVWSIAPEHMRLTIPAQVETLETKPFIERLIEEKP